MGYVQLHPLPLNSTSNWRSRVKGELCKVGSCYLCSYHRSFGYFIATSIPAPKSNLNFGYLSFKRKVERRKSNIKKIIYKDQFNSLHSNFYISHDIYWEQCLLPINQINSINHIPKQKKCTLPPFKFEFFADKHREK